MNAHLATVRDAPTPAAGRQAAAHVLQTYGTRYPAAMKRFGEDLEASLAHLDLPLAHRKHVRTTKLIERSFVEEGRRTQIMPRFCDEKSGLKLVFVVLIRASARWQRVRMTELDRKPLAVSRASLGLDPDPGGQRTIEDQQVQEHVA